jgi:hypothetical protein
MNATTQPDTSLNRNHSIRLLLPLMLAMLALLFYYTLVHEGGHALAGIAAGGQLQQINLNFFQGPHVNLSGSFTQGQDALKSIAGPLLPVVLLIALLAVTPRRASWMVECLKFLSTVLVSGSLLPGIVIPWLFLAGRAPLGDDITSFLELSKISPPLVSLGFALVIAAAVSVYLVRSEGRQAVRRIYRFTPEDTFSNNSVLAMRVSAAFLAAGLVVATLTGSFQADGYGASARSIPDEYSLAVEQNLSGSAFEAEPVATFSLTEPALVGILIQARQVRAGYLDLTLVKPGNDQLTLFHAEEYSASNDQMKWEDSLPSGEYQLLLTSRDARGEVRVYLLGSGQPAGQ